MLLFLFTYVISFQHVTEQFYIQNEMSIRGFGPKPILPFDEIQLPSKHDFFLQKQQLDPLFEIRFTSKCHSTTWLCSTNTNSITSLAYSLKWQ